MALEGVPTTQELTPKQMEYVLKVSGGKSWDSASLMSSSLNSIFHSPPQTRPSLWNGRSAKAIFNHAEHEQKNSNSNSNSKTLFCKDCSLGSFKNLSNN